MRCSLSRYPDSESAPDALLIRADAGRAGGKTEAALVSQPILEARAANRASSPYVPVLASLRAATDLSRSEALEAADRASSWRQQQPALPDHNEVLMTRSLALDRLGRHDEAYAQWDALIKAAPDDISAARAPPWPARPRCSNGGRTAEAHTTIDAFINSNSLSRRSTGVARGPLILSDILRAEGNDFRRGVLQVAPLQLCRFPNPQHSDV